MYSYYMKILFLSFFTLFFASSPSLAAISTSANTLSVSAENGHKFPLNWKEYSTSDPRWSIRYPRGWRIMPNNEIEATGIKVDGALQRKYPIQSYAPFIVINHEKLKNALSPQEYSNAARKSVQSLRDYKLLSLEVIHTQDGEHSLHVFTAKSDDSNLLPGYFYQVYTVIDETGFVVTAYIPNRSFSKELDTIIRRMLSSIYFRTLNITKMQVKIGRAHV